MLWVALTCTIKFDNVCPFLLQRRKVGICCGGVTIMGSITGIRNLELIALPFRARLSLMGDLTEPIIHHLRQGGQEVMV